MLNDPKRIDDFITEALAIEAQDAKEAGALGYMCRALVQATLPHRATEGNEFSRTNGAFTLSIMAPSKIGLPYGSVPRLLLAWVTTTAVQTKSRDLMLGHALSEFMRELGLHPTGGQKGDITRLRNQMRRLFSSFISCSYTDETLDVGHNITITDSHRLWWDPKQPEQIGLFESSVTLSQRFFEEIIRNPVPVDLRAIKVLKNSPMALDIYTWLTYRMFTLKRQTVIPWPALEMQFGADYAHTRNFKIAFLKQLKKVHEIYRDVKVTDGEKGLILTPSPTHIKRIVRE